MTTEVATPVQARRLTLPAADPGVLSLAISLLSLAVLIVSLAGVPASDINGYGLGSAYPTVALAAFAALVLTLMISLATPRIAARWLTAQVVVLVVALQVGPALIEPLPRFATAWVHAGLAEYIARTGDVLAHTDARFSWPGFFAAAGFFAQAVGVEPLALLRWTPLLLGLLYLIPAAVIIRVFIDDERQRVIALAIFVLGNWVGQDYFAPQSLNFLLFLVMLAAVLRLLPWAPRETGAGRVVARILRRDATPMVLPPVAGDVRQRVAVLLLIVTMYAASAVSHQLTQFFTLFALAALVVVGVCRLGWLVVLMAVITVAYFVWGAQDYWSGHLHDLTSDLGGLGSSIHTSVVSRTTIGTTPERAAVVNARLGLSAAVLLLALVGLSRSRRRILVVPALLAAAPVLVMALQSYGGEAALRVYLFALLWLAILGAHAFVPARAADRPLWLRRTALVLAPLISVAVVTGFLLARFGNENFEQMRPNDVAAAAALYRIAPKGSSIFVLTESAPWRDHAIERFDYAYAEPPPLTPAQLPSLLAQMRAAKGRPYLLLTDGQWSQMHFLYGVPSDQVAAAQQMYATTRALHRVYGSGTVGVYELAQP